MKQAPVLILGQHVDYAFPCSHIKQTDFAYNRKKQNLPF